VRDIAVNVGEHLPVNRTLAASDGTTRKSTSHARDPNRCNCNRRDRLSLEPGAWRWLYRTVIPSSSLHPRRADLVALILTIVSHQCYDRSLAAAAIVTASRTMDVLDTSEASSTSLAVRGAATTNHVSRVQAGFPLCVSISYLRWHMRRTEMLVNNKQMSVKLSSDQRLQAVPLRDKHRLRFLRSIHAQVNFW